VSAAATKSKGSLGGGAGIDLLGSMLQTKGGKSSKSKPHSMANLVDPFDLTDGEVR
jgi:hypothetical protein